MAETLARPRIQDHATLRRLLGQAGLTITGSIIVAICAHLAIPLVFTPVPLSMAPFAVVLLGLLFGPAVGFATLCLYLAEGAAGLPVFSPLGPGGILQLLGPTGGYLLSYPAAAALAGYLFRRRRSSFALGVLAAGAANLLILLAGASWLMVLTHMRLPLVFSQAVFPFLPGDVLKVFAAAALAQLVHVVHTRRELKKFLSQDHDI